MPITSITLDCGMPVLVESMSGVRSAGLSWLLPGGGARDPADKMGLSTLLAEMVVRGAGGRSSRDDADAFDKLGVARSVSSESQFVSVGATMLGSRVMDALPLIVDIVRRPNLEAADLEPSRDLCVQAIESLKDDPQERVMHTLRGQHNPDPIGRSSLGTEEGLARVAHGDLAHAWARWAVPGGAILAIAGGVEPEPIARRLNELLKGWQGASAPVTWSGTGARGMVHETEQTNQVHLAVCYDSPPETDENCWLERVGTAVLSGGMSGRLFTEVREKRALCYSVYASYAGDKAYGRSVAYSGTTPERAQETLTVLLGELRRILTPEGRVTGDELQRALVGLKSKLVMSGESSNARAGALARDQHRLGRGRSLEELASQYDRVTLDRLNAYLGSRQLGTMTLATIGPTALTYQI
ncbi:MAG: M16 family metallopeptidase [Phycisphaerales bacterium]